MAVCWVILRGQQIDTVIQAVHSLLYIVAKCHFFSVVTWKDIIKYLQKCEGCTHFCEILYLHPYYHHANSIWSESWSPAPLAALLDFGHNSDLCGQAGHSSIKYIYHYYHSVGIGSYIYFDSTLISLSRWTILNSSSWGAANFLITLCRLFKLSEGDFSTAVEGLTVALVLLLLKAGPGTLFSPYSYQVMAASFPSLRDIPLCFLTVLFNFPVIKQTQYQLFLQNNCWLRCMIAVSFQNPLQLFLGSISICPNSFWVVSMIFWHISDTILFFCNSEISQSPPQQHRRLITMANFEATDCKTLHDTVQNLKTSTCCLDQHLSLKVCLVV